MTPDVGFHPAARRELLAAADFCELENPGLGGGFLNEVELARGLVIDHPKASPAVLGQVRKRLVARFPYSVCYPVREGGIHVSASAHHSRRPFYWQRRLLRPLCTSRISSGEFHAFSTQHTPCR
jgi:hypothetical protein